MQATVELLDLKPAAIEHIDRPLFDQTKGQLQFRGCARSARARCEALRIAILIVEFFDDDVAGRLAALSARKLGLRTLTCTDQAEMNLVWSMRKAGLSLLTGRPGPAKPVACIEDAAVRPAQLPAYVAGLESIMHRSGWRSASTATRRRALARPAGARSACRGRPEKIPAGGGRSLRAR